MPRDYTAPPLPADLELLLTQSNVWDASLNLDLEDALRRGVEGFEQDVHCKPFLAAGADSARKLDPPGPQRQYSFGLRGGGKLLDLTNAGAGLVALTSLFVGSTQFTLDEDFYLEEANAPAEAMPYTRVRFVSPLYAKPQGIVITGRWGYVADEIPVTAWEAMLFAGALNATVLPVLGQSRRITAEGLQQIKAKETGPVRTEYSTSDAAKTDDLDTLISRWSGQYLAAVNRYRLVGS